MSPQQMAVSLLNELFIKEKVFNLKIRKDIETVFCPTFINLLRCIQKVPLETRINITSMFLLYIQSFIYYCVKNPNKESIFTPTDSIQKINGTLIPEITQSFLNLVNSLAIEYEKLSIERIQKVPKSTNNTTSRKIINEVFLDELVCNIGEKIKKYKKTEKKSIKDNIKSTLEKLIQEYNEVSGREPLTFEDVMKGKD